MFLKNYYFQDFFLLTPALLVLWLEVICMLRCAQVNTPVHVFPLPTSWILALGYSSSLVSSEGKVHAPSSARCVTLMLLPAHPSFSLLPSPVCAHSQNSHSPQDLESSFVSFYPINPVSFSSLPLPLPLFPTLTGCQQLHSRPSFPLAVVFQLFPQVGFDPFWASHEGYMIVIQSKYFLLP